MAKYSLIYIIIIKWPGGALMTRQARQGCVLDDTIRVVACSSSSCHFRRSQGSRHLIRRTDNSSTSSRPDGSEGWVDLCGPTTETGLTRRRGLTTAGNRFSTEETCSGVDWRLTCDFRSSGTTSSQGN